MDAATSMTDELFRILGQGAEKASTARHYTTLELTKHGLEIRASTRNTRDGVMLQICRLLPWHELEIPELLEREIEFCQEAIDAKNI